MKYLKISNRGSLNRKYLELIGFGSKRDRVDDASVIGNKGSGTKLASVAAVRLELDVNIASTDYIGPYMLRFRVEKVDVDGATARQIFFDYVPYGVRDGKPYDQRYPSAMVVEAFQDWDQAIGDDDKRSFKVLREFVCNALDADKRCLIEIVDAPSGPEPGRTAVYLKYTTELRDILQNVDRYFKFLSKRRPLFTVPAIGDIYEKSDPEKTRLFAQGVLVDCDDYYWRSTLFDYSLNKKALVSEERIIKNMSEFYGELAILFGQLTDEAVAAAVMAAVAKGKAKLEESAFGHVNGVTPAAKAVWLKVVHGLFGEKLAVASGNATLDRDCQQIFGYSPVGAASTSLRHFLEKLGLPKASDIVPHQDTLKYELVAYRDLDVDSRLRFQAAYEKFAELFPERARIPIVFYFPLDENLRKWAGFSGVGDKKFEEIWIATATRSSLPATVEDVFMTLAHEGRHCVTKADDYDRAFVYRAEQDVLRAVYGNDGPHGQPLPQTTERLVPNIVDPSAPPAGDDDTLIDLDLEELMKDIADKDD